MNGIEHAIQFLSNDYHFSSPGAKAEAKEILVKLQRENKPLTEEEEIIKEMGNYLSVNDNSHYPAIIAALKNELKFAPESMLDYVEYDNDGEPEFIPVWEKVQYNFTVREFCELVGIKES